MCKTAWEMGGIAGFKTPEEAEDLECSQSAGHRYGIMLRIRNDVMVGLFIRTEKNCDELLRLIAIEDESAIAKHLASSWFGQQAGLN